MKIYAEVLEDSALEQFEDAMKQDFVVDGALMPDAHKGYALPIGAVVSTLGHIVPAWVGYDIGCTDMGTEYLTETGWKKISEYNAEKIMVYDPNTQKSQFSRPLAYIKDKCISFNHIKTKYGIDQMLSDEHTVLLYKYNTQTGVKDRINKESYYTITAKELVKKHNKLVNGIRDKFLTTIPNYIGSSHIFTNNDIRLQIAVCADSSIVKDNCVINLKKSRKIERLIYLLDTTNTYYTMHINNGITTFRFTPPSIEKRLSQFWLCSKEQHNIISDEIFKWDGTVIGGDQFTSKYKEDCDLIQYSLAISGIRSTIYHDNRDMKETWKVSAVTINKYKEFAGINSTKHDTIKKVKSIDGFKYCFSTSTGFWVMRRNGNISITGNCGMCATKLNIKKDDLYEHKEYIFNEIYRKVPVGFSTNGFASNTETDTDGLTEVGKEIAIKKKWNQAIGSLGGGNHFIEIGYDENDFVWIIVHSGSRGVGYAIATHYMKLAKELSCVLTPEMKLELEKKFNSKNHHWMKKNPEGYFKAMELYIENNKPKADKMLDGHYALTTDSKEGNDYIRDLNWCLDFALENRKEITRRVIKVICNATNIPIATKTFINRNHNHAVPGTSDVGMVWVHRKGATHAEKDMLGVIPGNMRDGSFIVKGKGNPDSLCSSSHGAGRVLGRKEANRVLDLEDYKEKMKGVVGKIDKDTLDESPDAYKNIFDVMDAQKDLVEVLHHIKPLINIKG